MTATSSEAPTKPKVQKTNRVRMKRATIYCSCEITREIRDYVIRSGMVLIPKRGEYDNLLLALRALTRSKPDHFPRSSISIIESHYDRPLWTD